MKHETCCYHHRDHHDPTSQSSNISSMVSFGLRYDNILKRSVIPFYDLSSMSAINTQHDKTFRFDMSKFTTPAYTVNDRRVIHMPIQPYGLETPSSNHTNHTNHSKPAQRSQRTLLGFPIALLVAATCCFVGTCVFTISIVTVTNEMTNARLQLMPLINAAVPMMKDGDRLTSIAVDTSQQVLDIAENAKNMSSKLNPILQNLVFFVNRTAAAMDNLEHYTKHPSLHINLENSDDRP